MGALYLAIDHAMDDREIVLKALLDYFDPTNSQDVYTARVRFSDEASILARLNYPSLPRIFDLVQDGAHTYIAMQYIDGQNLEEELTVADPITHQPRPGQPYPVHDVLRWGIALCRTLEYLVSRQPHPVLHQDIKPANLIVERTSADIYLVDFGAAGAPPPPSTNGAALLQQQSRYGTPGYAPPEQYRGHSEPRSDVYALAATLYHLATDDNPQQHPFQFPALPQLGRLGAVLGAALAYDVAQRLTASAFRQQLEALQPSGDLSFIVAPDGMAITSMPALIAWCEEHWSLAAAWLYSRLPAQLELWWGYAQLAQELRAIVQQHPDEHAGLDSALALLDPHGFGAAPVLIAADASAHDFGSIRTSSVRNCQITFSNIGRRWVQAQLDLPTWACATPPELACIPGHQSTLTLTTSMQQFSATGGKLRHQLRIQAGAQLLLELELRVAVARWRVMWQQRRRQFLVDAVTLIVGLILIIPSLYWEGLKTRYYIAGEIAQGRGAWAEASRAYTQVLLIEPAAGDVARRLAETNYQAARAAIATREWAAAAAAVVMIEAVDSRYRDLPDLLTAYPELLRAVEIQRHAAWETGRVREVSRLGVWDGAVSTIAFSPDGQLLAVGTDHAIRIWRVYDGQLLWALDGHAFPISSLAFSADGQFLASGDKGVPNGVKLAGEALLKLWRVSDGALLQTFETDMEGIASLTFSDDDRSLIAVGAGMLTRRRIPDGAVLQTLSYGSWSDAHAVLSPDRHMLATDGTWNRTIDFWDVAEQALIRSVEGHDTGVAQLVFSPDGHMLASGGCREIKLWRVSDGALLRVIAKAHTDGCVWSLAFSADGQFLVSSSAYHKNSTDSTIKLWRVSDGALIYTFSGLSNSLKHVAFGPNGQPFASGDASGIILWHALP
jgi:tRNA A-37 threonylcarbamoyl transferase component Bud32